MKKKIIITFTICLFAAGSIFNMNLARNDQNMDISLADISVMAQAGGESYAEDMGTFYYSCSRSCGVGQVALVRKCEPESGSSCNISAQHSCQCPPETVTT